MTKRLEVIWVGLWMGLMGRREIGWGVFYILQVLVVRVWGGEEHLLCYLLHRL
jgi:hypothetical protein